MSMRLFPIIFPSKNKQGNELKKAKASEKLKIYSASFIIENGKLPFGIYENFLTNGVNDKVCNNSIGSPKNNTIPCKG
jgi:hypothetical protein